MKRRRKQNKMPIQIMALAVVLAVVALGFVTLTGSFLKSECREVQQPYVVEECNEVETGGTCRITNIKFTDTLNEETVCSSRPGGSGFSCAEETTTCILIIENTDSKGGQWTINTNMILNGNTINKGSQQIYVKGESNENIFWTQTHDPDATIECNYKITKAPQKEICEVCEKVTKYRTVEICD